MKHYIEITLLPPVDISIYFLWEKVFQKIHFALHDAKNQQNKTAVNIGVSFPEYNEQKHFLGSKIRLFSTAETDLIELDLNEKLAMFRDYIHVTSILEVPTNVTSYARYKRERLNKTLQSLAKRKSKREKILITEALKLYEITDQKHIKTPFINVLSKHSEQQRRFKLFIKKEHCDSSINKGFSSYGLSSTSTVPEF